VQTVVKHIDDYILSLKKTILVKTKQFESSNWFSIYDQILAPEQMLPFNEHNINRGVLYSNAPALKFGDKLGLFTSSLRVTGKHYCLIVTLQLQLDGGFSMCIAIYIYIYACVYTHL
jgi:hypothetical protein